MLSREKLSLIHVAKTRLAMEDDDYRAILSREANVASSRELNDQGFDRVMAAFERLGFESTAKAEKRKEAGRLGTNATYAQRRMMQQLWNRYKGASDPAGLRHWLSNHFQISDLRFVSAAAAPKIIHALNHFPKPEAKRK
jgi:phage gp16-like protein